jgi:hypothetical protein
MLELEPGCFINLDHVECMYSEASCLFVKMISGEVHVVSPFQFGEILRLKKFVSETSGQGFVG